MEYKLTTETEWHEINSEILENVPFGIYEIRYKATDTAFASEIFTLNVEEKVKPKEITPTAEIEYSRRTLDYLNNTSTYLVNGKEYHAENGSLNIEDSWYGTTITIICKASNEKFQDSDPQEIYIPTLGDAPDFLEVQGTKIKNLKETIEISNKGENNWFTTGATELELEEGEYEIRFMSTTTSFASKSIIVKLEKEPESNYTIETGIKNVDNDIVCTAENNTDGYITATGIIAIYSSSGTLLKIETINGFNAGANDYSISNDFNEPIKVKYFIWTALDNMTAYANTNVSELTID